MAWWLMSACPSQGSTRGSSQRASAPGRRRRFQRQQIVEMQFRHQRGRRFRFQAGIGRAGRLVQQRLAQSRNGRSARGQPAHQRITGQPAGPACEEHHDVHARSFLRLARRSSLCATACQIKRILNSIYRADAGLSISVSAHTMLAIPEILTPNTRRNARLPELLSKWARIGLTFAPAIPILKNILNPEFKTNKLRHNSLRAARNRSAFHAVSFPQADPGGQHRHRPGLAGPGQRAHGGVRRACAPGRHRAGPAARPVGARHGRGRHRLDRPARTRHRPLRRQHPRRHRASAGRRRGLGAGAADRNRRRRPARAGRQPLPAARQPLGRRRTAAAGRRRRHAGSRHAGLGRPDDRDRPAWKTRRPSRRCPGSTICSSALAICPCRAAPPIPT